MLSSLADASRHPTISLVVIGLSVLGAMALLVYGPLVAGAALALILLTVAARFPQVVPVYLIGIAMFQPIIVRLLPGHEDLSLIVKRLDEFSLVFLFPVALARHVLNRTLPLPRRCLVALAVVGGLGLAASVLQHTPAFLVGLDAFLMLKGFVVFAVISAFPLDEQQTRSVLRLTLGLALLAAVVGVVEKIAPGVVRSIVPLGGEGVRLGQVTMVSFFDNEGQAGWFFAFAATACYAFYIVYRRNGLLGLFLLFGACAVLTLRRKPLGGLLVVLLVSVLMTRQTSGRVRTALLAAGSVGAALFAFGDTIAMVFGQAYDVYIASRDPTSVARTAMYIGSFSIAKDYFPLGTGFGLFGGYVSQLYYSPIYFEYGLSSIWGLTPEFNRFVLDAFWPHVLGELGFFGLLAFCTALGSIWYPLVRGYRGCGSLLAKALALCAVLTFLEALVESTAAPVLEATLSSTLLFGVAALATHSIREDSPER